jgi:hypothetical protein
MTRKYYKIFIYTSNGVHKVGELYEQFETEQEAKDKRRYYAKEGNHVVVSEVTDS